MVAIATGDTESLASATVTLLLFAFILVNVAVLVLRRDRVEHDHFTVPRALPVLGALVSIALLTQQAGEDFLRAGAFPALGVLLWLVNRLAGGEQGAPPGEPPAAAGSAS